MCIIFIKNKDARWPTNDEIENAWRTNSDGTGFAWVAPGDKIVSYVRGLMDKDTMIGAFTKLKETLPAGSVVVGHFRIGTSGTKTGAMTHPFPVAGYKAFWSMAGRTAHVFAHNGIFSDMPDDKNWSDTAQYVARLVTAMPLGNKPVTEYFMKKTAGGGKTVLLYSDGSFLKAGDWTDDKESGLSWSNSGYKGYGAYYRQHGLYAGWGDDDDYGDYSGYDAQWLARIRETNREQAETTRQIVSKARQDVVATATVIKPTADVHTTRGKLGIKGVKSFVYLPKGWTVYDDAGEHYWQGKAKKVFYVRGDSVLFWSGKQAKGGWEEIGYVTDVSGEPVTLGAGSV